jgi:2-polyprenyl-6-methoxyphenol hydroxylase-like FAD-dependent oxidoreductase
MYRITFYNFRQIYLDAVIVATYITHFFMYMLPENRIESLFSDTITESWNIHIRVNCNAKAIAQVTNHIPRRMIIR